MNSFDKPKTIPRQEIFKTSLTLDADIWIEYDSKDHSNALLSVWGAKGSFNFIVSSIEKVHNHFRSANDAKCLWFGWTKPNTLKTGMWQNVRWVYVREEKITKVYVEGTLRKFENYNCEQEDLDLFDQKL